MKDWTGNQNSIFKTLGASNHSELEREKNDFYATEPKAVELLLEKETFNNKIWECACGQGHISEVLKKNGYNVLSTDLIDRSYCDKKYDFLTSNNENLFDKGTLIKHWDGDIITNPPYKYALDFIKKSLKLIKYKSKIAMFLKIQFLEGIERRKFFNINPPKKIYVASKRLNCAKNGDFEKYQSSAVCYAWFIWEKGNKQLPVIDWIN